MTAHILGSSLNELLAVLGLPSQEASPAAAPEVRSRGSTAELQPRHCTDQLLCEARGKNPTRSAPSLLLFTKGSHELKHIKVAKWKFPFSRIWIVGKKFLAFKKKHLYAECTRGILTGRGISVQSFQIPFCLCDLNIFYHCNVCT